MVIDTDFCPLIFSADSYHYYYLLFPANVSEKNFSLEPFVLSVNKSHFGNEKEKTNVQEINFMSPTKPKMFIALLRGKASLF